MRDRADATIWFSRLPRLNPGERKFAPQGKLTVEGPRHPRSSRGERQLARLVGAVTLRENGTELARGSSEIIITDTRIAGVIFDGSSGSEPLDVSHAIAAFVVPWSAVASVSGDSSDVELEGQGWSMTWYITSRLDESYATVAAVTNQQVRTALARFRAKHDPRPAPNSLPQTPPPPPAANTPAPTPAPAPLQPRGGSAPEAPRATRRAVTDRIDLSRYHDLTQRLAAFSRDGGLQLRGDTEDLVIRDAEPLFGEGEAERLRLAGVIQLVGSRSIKEVEAPSLGVVLHGPATMIVTSERLIVMALGGASQLGSITDDEIHTFVLPWDLVNCISMPARKSVADRIAGSRTIELFDGMTMTNLSITPANRAEIRGQEVRVSDDEVMRRLVAVAVEHRLSVSTPEEHGRLQDLRQGHLEVSKGEKVAWISSEETTDVAPHLVGRLVQSSVPQTAPPPRAADTPVPTAPPARLSSSSGSAPNGSSPAVRGLRCKACGAVLSAARRTCTVCGAPTTTPSRHGASPAGERAGTTTVIAKGREWLSQFSSRTSPRESPTGLHEDFDLFDPPTWVSLLATPRGRRIVLRACAALVAVVVVLVPPIVSRIQDLGGPSTRTEVCEGYAELGTSLRSANGFFDNAIFGNARRLGRVASRYEGNTSVQSDGAALKSAADSDSTSTLALQNASLNIAALCGKPPLSIYAVFGD